MWIVNLLLLAFLFLVIMGLSLRLERLRKQQDDFEERLRTNDRLLQATLIDEFKNDRLESRDSRSDSPPD